MKKIIIALGLVLCMSFCVKPDERQRDSSLELNSLKAYVYYNQDNLSLYEEVDLMSGMYIEEKGLLSFTFPEDEVKFNANSLKRCRIEAGIPSTASVVLCDEAGVEKSSGLDGWFDLYNNTLYFKIKADNSDFKIFKITTFCL